MPRIGVLALQGAFREHLDRLATLGAEARPVRLPADLPGLDGLILPGGESTTMGKLMREYGLTDPIADLARSGAPVLGTCAGAILLARDIAGEAPWLALFDARIRRNAFGRQVNSFTTLLDIPAVAGHPLPAVFIRAPVIESLGPEAEPLATLDDGTVVAARQGNLLITSFHPELTPDTAFHRYFVDLVPSREAAVSRA